MTAGAVLYWVILLGRRRKCSRAIWMTWKKLIIFLTCCCSMRWLWPAVARLPELAILLREQVVLHPLLGWFSPLLLKMWFLAQQGSPQPRSLQEAKSLGSHLRPTSSRSQGIPRHIKALKFQIPRTSCFWFSLMLGQMCTCNWVRHSQKSKWKYPHSTEEKTGAKSKPFRRKKKARLLLQPHPAHTNLLQDLQNHHPEIETGT